MITEQINWNDDSGDKITITHDNYSESTLNISSSINHGVDREITLEAVTNIGNKSVPIIVSLPGQRNKFTVNGDIFLLSNGEEFNVIK